MQRVAEATDPAAGREAQHEAREKTLELLQAARRSETREDFEKFLAEKYGVTRDSPDYETFMAAWATYKRERG